MKEQIEKFKKGNIVINTETQEEYYELMKLLEEYDFEWSCDEKPTCRNEWENYYENTCIRTCGLHLMYARISFYLGTYQIIKYKDFIKEGNDKKMMPTSVSLNMGNWFFKPIEKKVELEKYIINNGATILFWSDKSKTISKRHKEDAFDKELGFLFAYFYKKCGLSNGARKRVIDCIDYSKIKTFLFEFYVKDSGKTYDQARSYLKNLKVDKKDKVEEVKEDNNFKIGDKVNYIGKTWAIHNPCEIIDFDEDLEDTTKIMCKDKLIWHGIKTRDLEKIK